jgi:hypothetical protein
MTLAAIRKEWRTIRKLIGRGLLATIKRGIKKASAKEKFAGPTTLNTKPI